MALTYLNCPLTRSRKLGCLDNHLSWPITTAYITILTIKIAEAIRGFELARLFEQLILGENFSAERARVVLFEPGHQAC